MWPVVLTLQLAICTEPRAAQDDRLGSAVRSRTFELEAGASLVLTDSPFDRKGHRLSVTDDDRDLLDGKPIYGTDRSWPRRKVEEIAVRFADGKRVALDVTGMFNPDSPGIDWPPYSMKRDDASGMHIVKGHFGDAAGSYDVEWAIRDGRSVRTSVDEDCGAYDDPVPPDDSRLSEDIPSRFAGCRFSSAAPWGRYNGAELDMVLRLDCPQQQAAQVVLRYRRPSSSADARWELAPRPDPFPLPWRPRPAAHWRPLERPERRDPRNDRAVAPPHGR